MSSILVIVALFVSSVLSDPDAVIVPCKKSDEVCMTKSANIALPIIAAGIPSLGVDGFEPARVEEISGRVSKLFFNYTNNEIAGYSKCIISDVNLNLDERKLKFNVTCPLLVLTGHLVTSGELLDVLVEGDDDYKLFIGKYFIKIVADIEKMDGADGRQHLAITTFKHKGIPLEPLHFHYDNFKTKNELSPEAAAAFEKEKHLKAIELTAEPFINILYKEAMFKSVNKFLESVPFEDLFID